MPTICREPRFLEFRIVASCVGCIGSIPSCQARLISSHNKAERIHRFPSPSPTGGYAQLQGAFSITQRPLNQTITLGFFPGHSWTPPLKLRRSQRPVPLRIFHLFGMMMNTHAHTCAGQTGRNRKECVELPVVEKVRTRRHISFILSVICSIVTLQLI